MTDEEKTETIDRVYQQLQWRCRRGTRELDLLLSWWLKDRYAQAHAEQQRAFVALLEQQDPELMDWINGRCSAASLPWSTIIDEIRARASF